MAELLFSSLFLWLIPAFVGVCVLDLFIPKRCSLEGTAEIKASPEEVSSLFLRAFLFLFHRKPDPVAIYIESLKKHFYR